MSQRTRTDLQPAYVLHRRPYRDTSLLLELFTRDHGRVGLVARGATRPSSRLRGLLEAFRPVLVSWTGRGDLGSLTGAESAGSLPLFKGNTLFSGLYLNELLMRLLTRHDPHPELFECYGMTLSVMGLAQHERALRLFEKRLLEELGYGLMLDQEADSGRPLDPGGHYEFQLESGPARVDARRTGGLCFKGHSLLSLHRAELADADSLRDAKRLMRAALSVYLGGRPLETRRIMESLARH